MERQAGEGALANCKGAYVRETPGPEIRATHQHWRSAIRLSAVFVAWSLAVCSHAVDIPATTLLPVVPGDEASRSVPFIAWYQDLSKSGYVEEEYLVSGDANLYEYVDDDVQSSAVRVGDEAIPYVSRLLIRRPVDAERFNGTLYLEVLNPSAGWDGDPIWQNTHEYLMRAGAIYAGLTSKPAALDFLRDKWGRDPFPVRNSSRYAQLEMPYFGQIWELLSEVAALLKSPGRDSNPLAGFPVRRTVLTGYSQSVAYQVTYANSFHARARMPDGAPLIDGYYLAAGGGAKNVNRPTPETESLPPGDRRNLVDVDVPVVRFQTETEVPRSHRLRQHPPEYPMGPHLRDGGRGARGPGHRRSRRQGAGARPGFAGFRRRMRPAHQSDQHRIRTVGDAGDHRSMGARRRRASTEPGDRHGRRRRRLAADQRGMPPAMHWAACVRPASTYRWAGICPIIPGRDSAS